VISVSSSSAGSHSASLGQLSTFHTLRISHAAAIQLVVAVESYLLPVNNVFADRANQSSIR